MPPRRSTRRRYSDPPTPQNNLPENPLEPLVPLNPVHTTPDTPTETPAEPPLDPALLDIEADLLSNAATMSDMNPHGPLIKFDTVDRLEESGSNFDSWLLATDIALNSRELLAVAAGNDVQNPSTYDPPAHPKVVAAWLKRDGLAKAQLALNVSMELLNQLDTSSAHGLYTDIQSRFKLQSANAHTIASRYLRTKIIGEQESMADHIKELRKLRAKYLSVGGVLPQLEWRSIVINSLTGPRWQHYPASLAGLSDPNEVINTLLLEESRMKSVEGVSQASGESAMRSNGRGRAREGRTMICSHCKQKGHTKKRCWAPGGDEEANAPSWYVPPESMKKSTASTTKGNTANAAASPGSTEAANNTETARVAGINHIALHSGANQPNSHTWLLDSGASSHMCNSKLLFTSYVEFQSPEPISSAKAGVTFHALGKGTVNAKFINDGKITTATLHNVLYAPDLDTNLISVSKLSDHGVEISFRGSRCYLKGSTGDFGYADRVGSLYHLRMTVTAHRAHIVSSHADISQDINKWHRRLGHVSESRILEMARAGTVNGMVITDTSVLGRCEACILGKHAATASPGTNRRATHPFERIHSDILFMGDASLGGAKYVVTFIDEHSGYVWVYSLLDKTGDTILKHFRELDTWVETQFGSRIKGLQSDNGGEFVNASMQTYLTSRGISHYTIAPHRHEMNGLAERFNRTLNDAVRTMLIDAHLSHGFWAEAVSYFAEVRNRSGNSFLDVGISPYEIIYGSKPDISHFRVFGCVAYARVPPETRRKLDNRSQKGLFVGIYADAAYRIMMPDRSIVKSKDVIFEEGPGSRTLSMGSQITDDPPHTRDDDTHLDAIVPTTDASLDLPLSTRRTRRSDKTTTLRKDGLDQELGLAHLDNPIPDLPACSYATHQRKSVGGHLVPLSPSEALSGADQREWLEAGLYELGKLIQHDVWDEVPRSEAEHIIRGKWVYNIKDNPDGTLEFRSRWVARGDSQLDDEYGELHATSGDYTVARIVSALAASDQTEIRAIDVSSAYLHSELILDKPIYVEYPTGFHPTHPNSVCRLKRALYGLKQGARAWQDKFGSTMAGSGFHRLASAPSAFYRSDAEGECLVHTHVDDCTAACTTAPGVTKPEGDRFEEDIGKNYQFTRKDLSKTVKILGWDVRTGKDWLEIGVTTKINRMVQKYGLEDAKTVRTPMTEDALSLFESDTSEDYSDPPFPFASLIGELMWLAMNARPEIAYAVQTLAKFTKLPKQCHWIAAKRVLRYLKGTANVCLRFSSGKGAQQLPIGYCDADWARDPEERKSTSGYVFLFAGGPISWKVKKQAVVALSSAEAEYLAVSLCAKEAIWMRHLFNEINRPYGETPTTIYVDNQAAIKMSQNPVYHSRTKHIDIPVHHIRDEVSKRRIELEYVPGIENPADVFTKPLGYAAHIGCMKRMGMTV